MNGIQARMRRLGAHSALRFALACAACFVTVAWGPAPESSYAAEDGVAPIRIKEMYVPYEVFETLTKSSRDGVIMELDEYRELVRTAARNARAKGEVELPPREAVVTSASYRGEVAAGEFGRSAGKSGASSVLITGELEVLVARDGWASCALGLPPVALGSVLVDGGPGWLIQGSTVTTDPRTGQALGPLTLLINGRGRHVVHVTFSMPIQDEGERSVLTGGVLQAAASTIEIVVPGEAEGVAQPGALTTAVDGGRTFFRIANGSASQFTLAWSRKRELDESTSLLIAYHSLITEFRPRQILFSWSADVRALRRKITELILEEPAGATVVKVSGELVHSFEPIEGGLRVILKEPEIGAVRIQIEGIMPSPGERFTMSAPRVRGAYANLGAIALSPPDQGALRVEEITGFREIEPSADARGRLRRTFAFAAPGASFVASVVDEPQAFESRSAFIARVWEETLTLHGLVSVYAKKGEFYQLSMAVPPEWRVTRIEESAIAESSSAGRSPAGLARGVRYDELTVGGIRTVRIFLDRALDRERALELNLRLEAFPYPPAGGDWNVALALPSVIDAERSRTDLAISLESAFYLDETDLTGWRALSPDETGRVGLEAKGRDEESSAARIVAGLTSEEASPKLALRLVQRPARGEYRAVVHLLATERAAGTGRDEQTLRVRGDFRLAVVDRGIDSLTFRLPKLPASASVVILGDGIKERIQNAAAGTHTILFARPWLETRQFRIEYEIPCTPGVANEIPVMALDGEFGGERFLVIQSQGSVEVESAPGAGVAAVDIDDVPDFAEPWTPGRVLGAFRFHAAGAPGTLKTVVHDRAPVLARLAREMKLETVIGQDGAAHTRAEFLLSYAREQALRMRLPPDARCIGVSVDGVPIRALRVEPPFAGDARPIHAVPLPPRSYCTISILYAEGVVAAGGAADTPRDALERWGRRELQGPELLDIPVGETIWKIYHPPGYRLSAVDGNVRAVDAPQEGIAARGAGTPYLLRLFGGGESLFAALRAEQRGIALVPLSPLTPEEAQGAEETAPGGVREGANQAQRIAPVQSRENVQSDLPGMASESAQFDGEGDARPRAPLHRLHPEGVLLELRKLGGDPRATIDYLEIAWWNFSKRAVFFGALALALWCGVRTGVRRLAIFSILGLLFATLLPLALRRASPLFLDPLCQALLWVFAASALALLWQRSIRLFRRGGVAAPTRALMVACLGGVISMFAFVTPADAQAPASAPAPGAIIDEQVLIPYAPERAPWESTGGDGRKAFVPEARFRELWRLASPEETDPIATLVSHKYLVGSATYELVVEGERFLLTGSVSVNVLSEGWVEVPIVFDAQPTKIRVDGVEQGVIRRDSAPYLALAGAGVHQIEFECVGPVQPHMGVYWIATRLFAGAAARIDATLPPGAVLDEKQSLGATLVARTDGATCVRFELGSRALHFAWSYPEREGDLAAQVESLSYTALRLTSDGFNMRRRERIRAAGRAVDRVSYQISGDWQVLEVSGNELAEWRFTPPGPAQEPARLTLVFARALAEAECIITGHAVMAERGTMPALTLEGAVRQESFVGLTPGSERRFLPESLSALRRATAEELARAFGNLGEAEKPDRILHVYGSADGESLAIGPVQPVVRLAADGVALWRADRMQYFVRIRYSQHEAGPLRHELVLPASWSVRRVQSPAMESWDVTSGERGQLLHVRFKGRAGAGTEIMIGAEAPLPVAGAAASLPALRFLPETADTRLEETWTWIIGAEEDLNLVPDAAPAWEPVALEAASDWFAPPPGTSLRLAYRTRRGDAALEIRATPLAGAVSAAIAAFARLGEEALHVNARVVYRMRSATREKFLLRLPPGAELVRGETRNQRRQGVRQTPLGTEVEFELQSAARDEQAIDLSYRVRRVQDKLPEILPIVLFDGGRRLEAVDQFVGVLQATRALTLEAETEGLAAVELSKVPYVPRNVSARSLRSTFQAVLLDWRLALREQEIELAGKLDAHIKLADVTTRIGSDGTMRTQVAYTLINRGLQFLTLDLPAGADLWGVTVNGLPVAVGGDGNGAPARGPGAARRVMIPVEHAGRSELPLEVILVYEENSIDLPALVTTQKLLAPRLVDSKAIPIEQTIWSVHFPDNYYLSETSERMRQAPVSLKSAEKVRSLLKQQESVREVAKGAESVRARQRAAQELARLEAALSDNLAELQASDRSDAERAQQGLVGEAETQQQWAQNTVIIQEACKAQVELREEIQQESERKLEAETSRDEEAFRDRCNFLRGEGWDLQKKDGDKKGDGKGGATRAPSGGPEAPGAARRADAATLLEEFRYRGFEGVPYDAGVQRVEVARPVPIEATGALAPIADSSLGGSAPRLDLGAARTGYVTYTFRRMDGDAELTLRMSERASVARVGAWVALLAAGLALVIWQRRRA